MTTTPFTGAHDTREAHDALRTPPHGDPSAEKPTIALAIAAFLTLLIGGILESTVLLVLASALVIGALVSFTRRTQALIDAERDAAQEVDDDR